MSARGEKIMAWQPHGANRGKPVESRTDSQAAYMEAIAKHELVLAEGPAGTGKTYLAAALAAQALLSGAVEKIIMSRPALEAGERLGFLPGSVLEKIDPYLRPLYDALGEVIGADETQRYIQAGLIEIAPLAFMRGRTLSHAFVILDEAQNCTLAQMKMFLTRVGQGSVFVVCGDGAQSDLPPHQPSGFHQALKVLAHLPAVATIHFSAADIQRSQLVADIVRAYEEHKVEHKTR